MVHFRSIYWPEVMVLSKVVANFWPATVVVMVNLFTGRVALLNTVPLMVTDPVVALSMALAPVRARSYFGRLLPTMTASTLMAPCPWRSPQKASEVLL